MDVIRSSEPSVLTRTKLRHIPGDGILHMAISLSAGAEVGGMSRVSHSVAPLMTGSGCRGEMEASLLVRKQLIDPSEKGSALSRVPEPAAAFTFGAVCCV
jgi:hypothetical protein